MFVPGKLIPPSLLFESKAAAYPTGAPLRLMRELPRGEHLNDAPLGKALAILANIRLGWTVLPVTNALAYSDHRRLRLVYTTAIIALSWCLLRNIKIFSIS